MRSLRVLLVLIALLSVGLLQGSARAEAPPDPSTVMSALRSDPLYLAPDQTSLDAAGVAKVRDALKGAKTPIYLIVTADQGSATTSNKYLATVAKGVGSTGVYALLAGNHFTAGSTNGTGLKAGEAVKLASQAARDHKGDPAAGLAAFIDQVDIAAGKKSSASSSVASYVLIGLLIAAAGGVLFFISSSKKKKAKAELAQLNELKAGVEEDVTLLGEDIARLDLNLSDPALAGEAKDEYAKALDSYDAAKTAMEQVKHPEEMSRVTTALEDGRYYMMAVRARLAGQPVPERRAPCFFNPQHGPSVQDVMWAPAGGQPREVPACAADAERVLRGADPESRLVNVDGYQRPYWDAGPQWAPYAGGYYAGYGGLGMLNTIMIGTALGSMWGGGFGGYGGYGGGYDNGGGGDFGGDFGGGGDFGSGGDFGGGGGDFGGGGGDF